VSDQPPPPVVTVDGPLPAEESARRDERMLHDGAPAVRVAILADRSLSYGVAVPRTAPYLARAEAAGIPIVARRSGGTGVVHEAGDLTWAIVLPRGDPRVGRDFVHAYRWFGEGPRRLLERLGLPAAWVPAPRLARDYCPLGDRGEVLEAGGRIVGGAAQHVIPAALLHHGFLALRVDRPGIEALFDLPHPGPADRLGGLSALGVDRRSPELAADLARAIAAALLEPRTRPGYGARRAQRASAADSAS
jgi:hypothetical protein